MWIPRSDPFRMSLFSTVGFALCITARFANPLSLIMFLRSVHVVSFRNSTPPPGAPRIVFPSNSALHPLSSCTFAPLLQIWLSRNSPPAKFCRITPVCLLSLIVLLLTNGSARCETSSPTLMLPSIVLFCSVTLDSSCTHTPYARLLQNLFPSTSGLLMPWTFIPAPACPDTVLPSITNSAEPTLTTPLPPPSKIVFPSKCGSALSRTPTHASVHRDTLLLT
mmetsp:Transcript_37828/g.89515  ORF Transcript_37828/g.89515 Transcript_37828/m.89515 type:complete len:222 (-) Transcript_37828:228-893(-)